MGVQVQKLYKGESGEIRSLIERQFISFSFGGKNIEEFDLVSTINDNSLNKIIYSEFKDTTSDYVGIDGQIYWLSTFSPYQLNFILSTDGIEEKTLEDFKFWFKPGAIRELILSEHSNRYALARVASAPILNMLPFEKKVSLTVGTQTYYTSTTEYKGNIELSLILDEPFWYSKDDFFSSTDLNNNLKLKTIIEDRIPYSGVFSSNENILLANNKIYNNSSISENEGIDLNSGAEVKLYHSGSANAKPIINFELIVNSDGAHSYSFDSSTNKIVQSTGYNSIFIKRTNYVDRQFKYCLPDILNSYNLIIDYINIAKQDLDGKKLYQGIRDGISSYIIRSYCLNKIDELINSGQAITQQDLNDLIADLKTKINNITFEIMIDSKTGNATLQYEFNDEIINEKCGNMIKSKYIEIEGINDNSWDCFKISCTQKIYNFKIIFKNTYL